MLPSPPGLKPDYGIDAPGMVRIVILGSAAAILVGGIMWQSSESQPAFMRYLAPMLLWPGLAFLVTGLVMYWGSKVGKLRLRDQLIEKLNLKGDEQVLDVGCGRGLMLLGIARKLTTGRAAGIDLWQVQDQSGNAITTTEENARREGVAERVELHTGNMCELPFDDNRFDVIVSSWAIHNVSDAADRKIAVSEMYRVLKPGGRLVIIDISCTRDYLATLHSLGCTDIQRPGPSFTFVIPSYQLWATKP